MDQIAITAALQSITSERDPTIRSAMLASLCTEVWRERGVELVVVGGSAIEFLTEGAYVSGDLDMCYTNRASVRLRERQEVMGLLGGRGGPRSWQIAGMYVDLLGEVESFAKTAFRRIEGPYGEFAVMKPEDLLVERTLVAFYPGPNETALGCAKKLAAVMLAGNLAVDWKEVQRVAGLPEYRNVKECETLVKEVADELGVKNPLDSP